MKQYYAVLLVESERQATVNGTTTNVTLSWADGQVGVLAVFSNKRKAEKYAGGREIITLVTKAAQAGEEE